MKYVFDVFWIKKLRRDTNCPNHMPYILQKEPKTANNLHHWSSMAARHPTSRCFHAPGSLWAPAWWLPVAAPVGPRPVAAKTQMCKSLGQLFWSRNRVGLGGQALTLFASHCPMSFWARPKLYQLYHRFQRSKTANVRPSAVSSKTLPQVATQPTELQFQHLPNPSHVDPAPGHATYVSSIKLMGTSMILSLASNCGSSISCENRPETAGSFIAQSMEVDSRWYLVVSTCVNPAEK